MPDENNFSGIPSLDDVQGMENYVAQQTQDAALQQAGVQPQGTPAPQPTADDPAQQTPPQPQQQTYTKEDLIKINQRLDQIQQAQQAQQNQANLQARFSDSEIRFINEARRQGYQDAQILQTIRNYRAKQQGVDPQVQALNQRIANLEQNIQNQEFVKARTEFVDRMTTFGNKWGLSEQDIVTFANAAANKGINIANVMDPAALDGVFQICYPEQYKYRYQRMNSQHSASQLYPGTQVSENTRKAQERTEDAYVEQFMKQSMPGYFKK